jgi:hypothetical protein
VLFAGVTPDGTNNWKLSAYCNGAEKNQVAIDWTSHSSDDTAKPQNEAISKASGLTPPMWL